MLFHGKKGSIPVAKKLWIIIGGESNSGGLGFNSELPQGLLLPTPKVQLWDNTANNSWLPLTIGTNNLVGHEGLSNIGLGATRHGLERVISDRAKKLLYLTKTGQGGSRISQWLPADASGYYNTLASRVSAASSSLTSIPHQRVYVWWQGVNDANDGNFGTQWRVDTQAHFSRVRTLLGATTPVVVLNIMPNTANKVAINNQIALLADSLTYVVNTQDANNFVQSDTNHWTTEGYNIIGNKVVDTVNSIVGIDTPFT